MSEVVVTETQTPETTVEVPVTNETAPVAETPVAATPETPPVPAPAPVVAAVPAETAATPKHRGRQPGTKTLAIHGLLEADPTHTYATAGPLLAAAGVDVDENTWNVTKSQWKRKQNAGEHVKRTHKKPAAAAVQKVEAPEVSAAAAFAYVQECGGLKKAEEDVFQRAAKIKAFKELLKQTQKLAS